MPKRYKKRSQNSSYKTNKPAKPSKQSDVHNAINAGSEACAIEPLQLLPSLTYSTTDIDHSEHNFNCSRLEEVPMEYRAQIPGRCQRQFVSDDRVNETGRLLNVETWLAEWIQGSSEQLPHALSALKADELTHFTSKTILQRLVSNCGTDDGLIRPVIGAGGWPLIPGSSIKGLFRRQCIAINDTRLIRWCGNSYGDEPSQQGSLRFHGALPSTPEWRKENGAQLLDIVHPQWKWQLGGEDKKHSAFAMISLFKPELLIPISSTDSSITQQEWEDIKEILSKALCEKGIGGRTASGYGVCEQLAEDEIFKCKLMGRGTAAQLLNGKAEYRTTMFRAAIRGMALRIFGGLCDGATAEIEVDKLFGGITGKEPRRGILNCRYIDNRMPILTKSNTRHSFTVYTSSGSLQWGINPSKEQIKSDDRKNIELLLKCLHGLVMSLGGFGKNWRRVDHDFFGASLENGHYNKVPIGCHWQWDEYEKLDEVLKIKTADDIKELLITARLCAQKRIGSDASQEVPDWQEIIHPQRMLIWTRIANDPSDSIAMKWFHAKKSTQSMLPEALRLHRTDIGGRLVDRKFGDGATCVSRAWHRLYPLLGEKETLRINNPGATPASNAAAFQKGEKRGIQSTGSKKPSLHFWNGPYLESFVLFPVNQLSPKYEYIAGAKALIDELDKDCGASADFHRLHWYP